MSASGTRARAGATCTRIALLVLLLAGACSAADLYVQSGVTGGTCAQADPCGLATALNSVAKTGDTLLLSGTFTTADYGDGLTVAQDTLTLTTTSGATVEVPDSPETAPSQPPHVFEVQGKGVVTFDGLAFTQAKSAALKGGTSFPPTPDVAKEWSVIAVQSSCDVVVSRCTFSGITVPSQNAATVNMGRLIVLGGKAVSPSLTVSDSTFEDLENVTAVYVSEPDDTDDAGGDDDVEAGRDVMVVVQNSLFSGNKNLEEAMIWLDSHDVVMSGFSLHVVDGTEFADSHGRFLAGQVPLTANDTAAVTVSDFRLSGNQFNVTYESGGFGLVEVTYANVVTFENVVAEGNALLNGTKSFIDPSLFGLVLVDVSRKQHAYTASVADSVFFSNVNANPIVFLCHKKTDVVLTVRGCSFTNNSVAVSASVSAISTSPGTTLALVDNVYEDNSAYDPSLLNDWNLGSGAVILCDGTADMPISGNDTNFDNNGKLRAIFGTCHKSCAGFNETQILEVCGVTGTTMATYVMSGLVGGVVLLLIVYHIYFALTQKKKEKAKAEGYGKLGGDRDEY